MGTLTLADFRAELLFDLRNRTDTTAADGFSTTRQDLYINAGYLWLCRPEVFRHRELMFTNTIAMVAGTQAYTFTPVPVTGEVIVQIRSVTHVEDSSDVATARRTKLIPHDEQWLQNRSANTGSPRDYVVRASTILLSPVPTANEAGEILLVSSFREPTALTDVAHQTVLSTLWDEVVVLAARWRAELHLGYRDLAEASKIDLVALVNEYKSFDDLHAEDWDWRAEVIVDSPMEQA